MYVASQGPACPAPQRPGLADARRRGVAAAAERCRYVGGIGEAEQAQGGEAAEGVVEERGEARAGPDVHGPHQVQPEQAAVRQQTRHFRQHQSVRGRVRTQPLEPSAAELLRWREAVKCGGKCAGRRLDGDELALGSGAQGHVAALGEAAADGADVDGTAVIAAQEARKVRHHRRVQTPRCANLRRPHLRRLRKRVGLAALADRGP